jgi:galactokinase
MTTINEKILKELYGCNVAEAKQRINEVTSKHSAWCKGEVFLFSSPGRIEVIGNHTDHNNGLAVAAAVSVDTLAAVTLSNDNFITIRSEGYKDIKVDVRDVELKESEKFTSKGIVRGVLNGLTDKGFKVGGFNATVNSTVPKGSGLSSSASFELLIAEILNALFNGGAVAAIELAKISQRAENMFFGKPSGLLDQAAVAMGGLNVIDFKDTKNPSVVPLNCNFENVSAVIINCGGDHCDLNDEYAAIKNEMQGIAKFFKKDTLRFVDEGEFYSNLAKLKNKFSGRAILRAMHFFDENKRVNDFANTIHDSRFTIHDIINQSGESSYKLLQNLYPCGNVAQPIPLALAIAKRFNAEPSNALHLQAAASETRGSRAKEARGVLAARVHGGGFAGTILTFVKNESRQEFIGYMSEFFGKENVFPVSIRAKGACVIN